MAVPKTFYFSCVLLLPIFLVGYPFYQIPIFLSRGVVSGTAYEPFTGRLFMHLLGERTDREALKLALGLPATNFAVRALIVWPIVWLSWATNYVPEAFRYPPPEPTPIGNMLGARCAFFDEAITQVVTPLHQVVILGAGWDTRGYDTGVFAMIGAHVFEVDSSETQRVKRDAVTHVSLESSSSNVTYVPCDFNKQSWLDALDGSGFRRDVPTFVLLEGVTMYLAETAVEQTLRGVAALPSGSYVAFDFFTHGWLDDTGVGRMAQWMVATLFGEPFRYTLDITKVPADPSDLQASRDQHIEDHGFNAALRGLLNRNGLRLDQSRALGSQNPDDQASNVYLQALGVYGGLVLASPDT